MRRLSRTHTGSTPRASKGSRRKYDAEDSESGEESDDSTSSSHQPSPSPVRSSARHGTVAAATPARRADLGLPTGSVAGADALDMFSPSRTFDVFGTPAAPVAVVPSSLEGRCRTPEQEFWFRAGEAAAQKDSLYVPEGRAEVHQSMLAKLLRTCSPYSQHISSDTLVNLASAVAASVHHTTDGVPVDPATVRALNVFTPDSPISIFARGYGAGAYAAATGQRPASTTRSQSSFFFPAGDDTPMPTTGKRNPNLDPEAADAVTSLQTLASSPVPAFRQRLFMSPETSLAAAAASQRLASVPSLSRSPASFSPMGIAARNLGSTAPVLPSSTRSMPGSLRPPHETLLPKTGTKRSRAALEVDSVMEDDGELPPAPSSQRRRSLSLLVEAVTALTE